MSAAIGGNNQAVTSKLNSLIAGQALQATASTQAGQATASTQALQATKARQLLITMLALAQKEKARSAVVNRAGWEGAGSYFSGRSGAPLCMDVMVSSPTGPRFWVAVGEDGVIATTTDSLGTASWVARANSFLSTDRIRAVWMKDSTALAVGPSGRVSISADSAVNWAAVTAFTADDLSDVFHDGESWIVVTAKGDFWKSANGSTGWTLQ